jgi:ATP-binding cassette subfamily F protein 3
MIRIANLSKSFGPQVVFEDVSVAINRGERLGLVGRNGHGKTTLLRMMLGQEHPDAGEILTPKNYRIGYLTQELAFTRDTLLDEGCLGLPAERADDRWRVEKILAGLGFAHADMDRHPREFSGGFQVRLNLAKVLVSDADLLLLDEPTNYLDVVSIRWLAGFLRAWKGELCLITHDRAFMDGVITHVAAIHRRKIRKMEGTTAKLYEIIDQEEDIHEKTRLNEEKKRKEAEDYINRFRAKARLASNVQSRIKALAKLEPLDKLAHIKDLRFSFHHAPSPARTLMSVSRLNFGYSADRRLIRDFSLAVGRRDRICVIGHNGQGKTTLLRLLVGDLSPQSGQIHLHNKTAIGYFAQTNIADLNPDWTVERELMAAGCDKQRARSIAGAMMFEGEAAEKTCRVLSGGEKARVLLGRVLAGPANLLLLDEPTNHLDMQSCDAFLDAVDRFEGAVMMVTHNEMFLHHLANRFVVFQQDRVQFFEGSYQEFLDKVGWVAEEAEAPSGAGRSPERTQVEPAAEKLSKKELRRRRAELVTRASKEVGPLKKRMEELEAKIIEAEERLGQLNEEVIAASPVSDGKKIGALLKDIAAIQARIDTWFEELERVSAKHDQKAAALAAQMNGLDGSDTGA